MLLAEHKGPAEPLCSPYDRSYATHIRQLFEKNQLNNHHASAGLKIRVISFDAEEWLMGNEFANISSVEELRKFDT